MTHCYVYSFSLVTDYEFQIILEITVFFQLTMIALNFRKPTLCFLSLVPFSRRGKNAYRKSSKETRGSYSFSKTTNAGLIRIRVLLEGGSYLFI